MKCRYKKCAGEGFRIPLVYQECPVYQCVVCNRRWAIKPKKKLGRSK